MSKRILAFILATAVVAGMTACNNKNSESGSSSQSSQAASDSNSSEAETLKDDLSQEITVDATRATIKTVTIKQNLTADMLKEKFNLTINTTDITSSDYITKMSLLFASGSDMPDFLYSLRPEWKLNEWVSAGFIKGFSKVEVETLLPNYVALYGDDWDIVYDQIKSSDSKIYYFPGPRSTPVNMAWTYRTDTLADIGMEAPKTTDEMYTLLKAIKEKTGRVPYVAASTPQCLWAFTGFMQSFGIPELAIRDLSYVNPVTDTFVPYAFSEDNYREFLIYMNKLYKEGLIWQEFATATKEQVTKFQSEGNGYVLWGYPEKLAEYTNISKTADATATWDWSKDIVSNDPNEVYFKRNPYFAADGSGFSSAITDEELTRMLTYFNWCCSEEGLLWNTYGKEGVTYEMKDGKPEYKSNIISPIQATGENIGEYSIPGVAGYVTSHPSVVDNYTPVANDLRDTFLDRENYYFFKNPVMQFTDEETAELTDITTSINDARDEYGARFIMGQLDPNSDKEWEKYLETMNQLGLDTLIKVRTDVYNRGK